MGSGEMNRDDIIRMATESNLIDSRPPYEELGEALERFAELVAAAERDACIKDFEEFAEWALKDDMGRKAKDMKAGVYLSVLLLQARNKQGELK
jgi:hypothetical protein